MSKNLRGSTPKAWREVILGERADTLVESSILLAGCAEYTGVGWVKLSKRDPLLCGAQAVLDRDASTIWIDESIPESQANVIIAHEYAHVALHNPLSHRFTDIGLIDDFSELSGYSRVAYAERCADKWASDLLLPPPLLMMEYLNGLSAVDLAVKAGMPHKFVRAKMLDALLNPSDYMSATYDPVQLNESEIEAAHAAEKRIVVAGEFRSGKTTTLAERCRFLMDEQEIDPTNILVLASGRNALNQIESALAAVFKGEVPVYMRPRACTVDSLCYELLRKYPEKVDLPEGWRVVLDDSESVPRSHSGVMIGDLVHRAIELLERHPYALEELTSQYPYLLIDSVEDFADKRLAFVERLAKSSQIDVWATCESTKNCPLLENATLFQLESHATVFGDFLARLAGNTKPRERKSAVDPDCVSLALAADLPSELSGVCELIRHHRNQGSPLERQAVLCASDESLVAADIDLRSAGLMKSETLWEDNLSVKDVVCLLIQLCGHNAGNAIAYRRRLERLFGYEDVQEAEAKRLRAFISPTEAIEEFLTGPCGYLRDIHNKPALNRLLKTVRQIEQDTAGQSLTPDQPGGGFETQPSLFQQVLDRLFARFETVAVSRDSPECAEAGEIYLSSIFRAPERNFDILYVLDFGRPSNDLRFIAKSAQLARKSLVVCSCLDTHDNEPKVFGELLKIAGQSRSDVIRFAQTSQLAKQNLSKISTLNEKDKPVYEANDLDLYSSCPRKYFYRSLQETTCNQAHDSSYCNIELSNCQVVTLRSEAILDKTELPEVNADSGIGKIGLWIRRLFEESGIDNSGLAPGQGLRYMLAAEGIAKHEFNAAPKSKALCRKCEYKWVCPE